MTDKISRVFRIFPSVSYSYFQKFFCFTAILPTKLIGSHIVKKKIWEKTGKNGKTWEDMGSGKWGVGLILFTLAKTRPARKSTPGILPPGFQVSAWNDTLDFF